MKSILKLESKSESRNTLTLDEDIELNGIFFILENKNISTRSVILLNKKQIKYLIKKCNIWLADNE